MKNFITNHMKKVWTLVIVVLIQSNAYSQVGLGIAKIDGLSDLQMVFEPGLKVGGLTVSKTFQPSFVVTEKGTLLVFCQGRLFDGEDNEPKVILMNKSYDFGKSWEGVEVISSPMNFFAISPYSANIGGEEKISFLTCVGLKVTKEFYKNDFSKLKEATGIDIEDIGKDKASVLVKYTSFDDGKSWTMEYLNGDNTPLFKEYNGYIPIFMNTIGQVHQIPKGPNKGRMIIAAPIYSVPSGKEVTNNFRDYKCSGSGIIYSDDFGETWKMDGMITDYLANEASAVSIKEGKEILMIRRINNFENYKEYNTIEMMSLGRNQRIANLSGDGGKSWSDPFLIGISEIACHGTLARRNNRLYFSIPLGLQDINQKKIEWDDDRIRGAVFYSDDEGNTWKSKVIEPSYFSYSTLGKLNNTSMITFFSRGGHGRFGIGYRVFSDEWLEN
ncbi:sialidase family protein [uncultured Cyclobacterium sp.]|uniref:sialidase family protein n=1 Tax=uncultured Cyclobacterium sp. TaxID=453820 RepID=UPI0030EBA7C3|tara:strand:+ start:155 stop:1480 length:1326 start_codon:yes stop_codon:yes gene_type:complete